MIHEDGDDIDEYDDDDGGDDDEDGDDVDDDEDGDDGDDGDNLCKTEVFQTTSPKHGFFQCKTFSGGFNNLFSDSIN